MEVGSRLPRPSKSLAFDIPQNPLFRMNTFVFHRFWPQVGQMVASKIAKAGRFGKHDVKKGLVLRAGIPR